MNTSTRLRFLDPLQILAYAGFTKGETIADFGSGNGFYPVAAARCVGPEGTVYAVDVKPEALEATTSAARHENIKNINTIRHDLEFPGVEIPENSCDAVILAGILHLSKLQKNVLRESYRVLKTGGKVVVIEWKKEHLPFGPDISKRLSESAVQDLMVRGGFKYESEIPADHFHFAQIYIK